MSFSKPFNSGASWKNQTSALAQYLLAAMIFAAAYCYAQHAYKVKGVYRKN